LNTLTDLIGPAVAVGAADLLAHVPDAQLVGEAVRVRATDGLAEFGVALEKDSVFNKLSLIFYSNNCLLGSSINDVTAYFCYCSFKALTKNCET